MITPFKNATRVSLKIKLKVRFAFISSTLSVLTVTASDCVPTLPAIPRISDWKLTISGSSCTIPSKRPTTAETISPKNKSTASHGILFATLLNTGSLISSSEVRAAKRA